MMKKKLGLMFSFLCLLGMSVLGLATSHQVLAENTDFTVSPVAPPTQLQNSDGYFNVYLKPGATETLNLQVQNKANKKRTMILEFNSGYTNENGNAVFDKRKIPADATLKYDMRKDMAVGSTRMRVSMKAKQTGYVAVKVKAPSTAFNGVIYGGLTATVYDGNAKLQGDGTLLKNDYRYAIPIFVRNVQDIANVQPEVKLGTIKPGIRNGKTAVLVSTKNTHAAYMNKFSVNAKVTRKGQSKVLHKSKTERMTIAPNSNFEYAIDWGGKQLESGTYHLSWRGSMAGAKSWHYERDFTITNAQAAKYNKLAGFKPNYLWLWILIGVLVVILLIVLGIWLGRRDKKGKSDSESSGNNSGTKRRGRGK